MANNNNNPGGQNPNGKEMFAKGTTNLWPVTGAAFSIPGYIPDKCVFEIPRDTLENNILEILQNFSKDFVYVRFEINPSSHQISLWAWITRDSRDITDQRFSNRDDLIISSSIMNLSPSMRVLQSMYGVRTQKAKEIHGDPSTEDNVQRRFNFVKPTNGDPRYIGTQLDIGAVMRGIMDANDDVYKKLYDRIYESENASRNDRKVVYTKASYNISITPRINHDGNCKAFVITKEKKERRGADNLHPKTVQRLSND